MDDSRISEDLEARDQGFLFMQQFFGQINEVAKEVMLLPLLNMASLFLLVSCELFDKNIRLIWCN
jgi:hypothetical protein